MKMYVANCSKQYQVFTSRMPETKKSVTQHIPMGGQIIVTGRSDLSKTDIDAIVEQHSKYGLIEASMVDRTKPFIGLCYSIDTPVSMSAIRRADEHNKDVLVERGERIRQESAVALNNSLEEQTGHTLAKLDLGVQEANPEKHEGDGPVVSEKVQVTRDAEQTATPKKTTERSPRAAKARA